MKTYQRGCQESDGLLFCFFKKNIQALKEKSPNHVRKRYGHNSGRCFLQSQTNLSGKMREKVDPNTTIL